MTSATKALRLPPMLKIGDIIRLYGLSAKKELSQNFILDSNVTDKMAKKADVFDCHVVEVGSGPGGMTRSLLKQGVRHLHAVDVDPRFIPSLVMLKEASAGHMSVHLKNILVLDIASILDDPIASPWESDDLPNIRLVGNLPFNVSLPIIFQWLEALSERRGPWKFGRVPMTLVFQKEVGEHMMTKRYNDLRNRNTIMCQNYCHVTCAMELKSKNFIPQPKVDAWCMHFQPRVEPQIEAPFNVVEQVVKVVFSQKRKRIHHQIGELFPGHELLGDELLERADVRRTRISRELHFKEWNRLVVTFMELCEKHGLSTTPHRIRKPQRLIDGDDDRLSENNQCLFL